MTDNREPRNPTELRRALKIGRPGQTRDVHIWDSKTVYSNRRDADHVFDINVHPDSHLTLFVHTGLPFLKLQRGTSHNVRVVFTSYWGNSLEIFPEQGATVSVPYADTKVTLTGDGRDLKVQAPKSKNRVGDWTHVDEAVIIRVFAERGKQLQ